LITEVVGYCNILLFIRISEIICTYQCCHLAITIASDSVVAVILWSLLNSETVNSSTAEFRP